MDWRNLLSRDPEICSGALVASGTRVLVTSILESLAEAYATKGDAKRAIELYTKARAMAPEAQHKRFDGELAKLGAKK